MSPIAFVTGADRGLGFALCTGLLEQGWRVFAGQYMPEWTELAALAQRFPAMLHTVPLDVSSIESACAAVQGVAAATDHIDLMINNAGIISQTNAQSIRQAQNYGDIHRMVDVNALGPLRVMEAFLPLLEQGEMKRLCFISSEAGSIERARRKSWYGYCMSKAALNMAVKIMFNDLRPDGFTFRVYHPGWVRSYMSGSKNLEADLEPEEAAARALPFFLGERDEDRLVLVDSLGHEWPW